MARPLPFSMIPFGAALIALLQGCAEHTWMLVPPKMDLYRYERIGLVEFHCTDPALQEQATRLFQEMLLDAQQGTYVVLVPGVGPVGDRSSGDLDQETVRALAEQHGLDAIFTGSLELSGTKSTIGIASSLVELSARSEIVGTMSARLIEPEGGATIWIRTAEERATVSSGAINSQGEGSLGMSDPGDVRSGLVYSLAEQVTYDFRAQYLRKRLEDIPPGYRATYPDGVEVYVPPGVPDTQY